MGCNCRGRGVTAHLRKLKLNPAIKGHFGNEETQNISTAVAAVDIDNSTTLISPSLLGSVTQ
jgi:hypothetical protein